MCWQQQNLTNEIVLNYYLELSRKLTIFVWSKQMLFFQQLKTDNK